MVSSTESREIDWAKEYVSEILEFMPVGYGNLCLLGRGYDVANLHYLLVLAFIAFCAIGVNFGFRLQIFRRLKQFLFTDALILVVYLLWDGWAVNKGSWFFDPSQILGTKFFGKLPVEEVLFFIIVPLMAVLTYLALSKLTGWTPEKEGNDDLL